MAPFVLSPSSRVQLGGVRFNSLNFARSPSASSHWEPLGLALIFAAMLGGLAYLPIRDATTDLMARSSR
ncbi:hypothetical protein FJW06_23530 [Mesorhizobium sp. B4-1-3]|uniref:hypothetical protein n=1 Tax=Mesorhizobium sp. B4-1-3 TaxID=2589889 RepID=UPI0011266E66|nr:hypothetical protein [Mesorhizobium sp. B4-1-3]TPI10318.1 hypothetical protein FJW06_23530 [Mesorhizobium sp. B4-1-3]